MARTRGKGLDWVIMSLYLSLVAIGVLMQYATYYSPEASGNFNASAVFTRQLLWVGISLIAFFMCLLIDWRIWNTFAYPIYGFAIFLLLAVVVFGTEIKGARSWIQIAGYSFQPSEFAKLAACLGVANFMSTFKGDFRNSRVIFAAMGLAFLPAALILLQPDAGSALLFLSFLLLFYVRGLSPIFYVIGFTLLMIFILSLIYSPQYVLLVSLSLIIGVFVGQMFQGVIGAIVSLLLIIGSFFVYNFTFYLPILGALTLVSGMIYLIREKDLKLTLQLSGVLSTVVILAFSTKYIVENLLPPHQQDRINVWLRPYLCDPRGSLYNLIQSKIAIGSGGMQGRGFLKGALTRFNYVPEQSTDFIFSVIGEEQGFIGAFSVIIIYAALIIKIVMVAERGQTSFITNYAYAVVGFLLLHFFVNIGMVMGLVPVIGIPLPFLSKGGTSLLVFSIMIGALLKMDLARLNR